MGEALAERLCRLLADDAETYSEEEELVASVGHVAPTVEDCERILEILASWRGVDAWVERAVVRMRTMVLDLEAAGDVTWGLHIRNVKKVTLRDAVSFLREEAMKAGLDWDGQFDRGDSEKGEG